MLYDLGELSVQREGDCFVAPSADVIGQVTLGHDVSIWFGAVVRADGAPITIGAGTNVQDNAVVHVDSDAPTAIGANVTIGHAATVHGCRVGDYSLIGIGATILSHAVLGRYCIVGANALITERKTFPDRSLIVGVPAKRVRDVTDDEVAMLEASAAHYIEMGRRYATKLARR
jgi:carbonic anhydrase/acetyltransferase-like protein (isoleucine patch superfamily)